jgi:hypothetical protein
MTQCELGAERPIKADLGSLRTSRNLPTSKGCTKLQGKRRKVEWETSVCKGFYINAYKAEYNCSDHEHVHFPVHKML